MQAIVAPSQRLDDCLWKINVWNLTRIERWRESIESFCLYGFELGDINGTLIRCDLQSRENWGQVTIVVPSLVTIEECVSPGFSKSVCPLVFFPWFFPWFFVTAGQASGHSYRTVGRPLSGLFDKPVSRKPCS